MGQMDLAVGSGAGPVPVRLTWRNLMTRRRALVLGLLSGSALYASCSPCVSSGKPADASTPVVISDGGFGDPCDTASQCRAGLECRVLFELASDAEPATSRACTTACSAGVCPAGFDCILQPPQAGADGGSAQQGLCVPVCEREADCQTGHRAGHCLGVDGGTLGDGGTLADGGVESGRCRAILCGGPFGENCPSTFICQDDRPSAYGCYPAGNSPLQRAPQASWCGR